MKKFFIWLLFSIFALVALGFGLKACSSASTRSTGTLQRYPGRLPAPGGAPSAPAAPSENPVPAIIVAIGSAAAAIITAYYGSKNKAASDPKSNGETTGGKSRRVPKWYRELPRHEEPRPGDILVYIRAGDHRFERIYCEPRYDEAP